MKKLLLLCLTCAISGSFADALGSLTSAVTNPNTLTCIKSCDDDTLLKFLAKNNVKAGSVSNKACKVACADSCFSKAIADGSSTATAAFSCKASLQKTFASK